MSTTVLPAAPHVPPAPLIPWLARCMGVSVITTVVSVTTLAATDGWLHGTHLGQPLRTLVILAAHLSGFGLLWVAQFNLLDRVLFARRVAVSTPE